MTKMLNPEDLGWIHDYQMIPYRWIQDLLIFVFCCFTQWKNPMVFVIQRLKSELSRLQGARLNFLPESLVSVILGAILGFASRTSRTW
jgi:hypothetical protein